MSLKVQDLQVSFPTQHGWLHAVDNVSFAVDGRETLVIVGESGCGKSATVRSLMGLTPTAHVRGSATLGGLDLLNDRKGRSARGTKISMVFQDPMTSLNPVLKIGRQLSETLVYHEKVSRSRAKRRALELLEEVRLRDPRRVAASYPHEISGGMRQRVVIAIALACGPEIILADEPTTALDVTVQAQILELLLELRSERGTGLVLITHDMGVARAVATKMLVMYAGQAVETGSAADVLDHPVHPYTSALMECLPPLTGPDPRHGRLTTISGSPPNLLTPPVGCRFAPRCRFGCPGDPCFDADRVIPLREVAPGHFARTLHRAEVHHG